MWYLRYLFSSFKYIFYNKIFIHLVVVVVVAAVVAVVAAVFVAVVVVVDDDDVVDDDRGGYVRFRSSHGRRIGDAVVGVFVAVGALVGDCNYRC